MSKPSRCIELPDVIEDNPAQGQRHTPDHSAINRMAQRQTMTNAACAKSRQASCGVLIRDEGFVKRTGWCLHWWQNRLGRALWAFLTFHVLAGGRSARWPGRTGERILHGLTAAPSVIRPLCWRVVAAWPICFYERSGSRYSGSVPLPLSAECGGLGLLLQPV